MLLSAERPIAGALAVGIPGATLLHRNGLVTESCRRRGNMCKRMIGVPQELGSSCRFLSKLPAGAPGYQLQASAAHSSAEERTERVNAEVLPSEGNEARRNGRQEVIAP